MTNTVKPYRAFQKTIGLQRLTYPEERNISSLNVGRAIFRIVPSQFSGTPQALLNQMNTSDLFRTCVACPVKDSQIDCYHYFNSLPLNGVPFVCTFESSVPRWWGVDDPTWHLGLDILASENCRQLFALSHNAVDLMQWSLARYGDTIAERIMKKVELVYPPQPLPQEWNPAKFDEDEIRIAFVGVDFLRKGGYEFLSAAAKLLDDGANIRVKIVSTMLPRSENFPWNANPGPRISEAQQIISRFSDRVSYSSRVSNAEVMQLFSDCHVSALPSFHDTFGYSVIEAQSNLCPAITTNQRAFPEVNPEAVGWTIGLPVDNLGQICNDFKNFADLSRILYDGILVALTEILNGGMKPIRDKAERALDRVRVFHNPQEAEDKIFKYYY